MAKHPAVTRECSECGKPFTSAREEQYWCQDCTLAYDKNRRSRPSTSTMRETKITFLPSCGICRNYPAQEVAKGVYRCTECRREEQTWQRRA